MSALTTRTFWADAIERSVKTIAQAMIAQLGAGAFGLLDVNYVTLLSVSGLAGLISLLTSIASSSTGNSNSASLVVETEELK